MSESPIAEAILDAVQRLRVNKVIPTMATDPEIKSLRENVARFRVLSLNVEIPLGAREGRLGVANPVAP